VLILASGKNLDRSSANIDDQHPWGRRRPCALSSICSSSPARAGETEVRIHGVNLLAGAQHI
jgi:hypothetical protein